MTMITTPNQFKRFHVAQVRGACRILAAGMTMRGMTKTKLAKEAGKITGKTYKLSQLEDAANDITVYLKENY